MKKYQITFEVPDDFDPEELELEAKYKDTISVSDEGFVTVTSGDLAKILEEKLTAVSERVSTGDVIILKYPIEVADQLAYDGGIMLQNWVQKIESKTGFPVLAMLDSIEFMVENKEESIAMLKAMIEKIEVRSSILSV